jgi:hypothetical protein
MLETGTSCGNALDLRARGNLDNEAAPPREAIGCVFVG